MEENPQPTPEEVSRWAIEFLKESALEKKTARELRKSKKSRLTQLGDLWKDYGASIGIMVTIISVVVGACWTIKLYVDQQAAQTEQRKKEVEQQQRDSELRKQSLVIQFASELGDKSKRNGAAYSLAVLGKTDAVSILSTHLKEALRSKDDVSFRDAIIDSLVTIGTDSFDPMIEMNRQARADSENNADMNSVIEATQTVIVRLLKRYPTYASSQKLNLTGVSFRKANLGFLNLAGVNLTKAYFEDTSLCSTDLHGAILIEAHFNGTTHLMSANLEGANIDKADFSGGLTNTSLSGINLKKATGIEVDFNDTDMSNAQLQGAQLTKSNFTRANLESADLSGAWLYGASFMKANLFGTKFIGAELTSVNFQAANLQKSDFSETNLQDASFFFFPDEKPRAPNETAATYAALVDDAKFYFAKNIGGQIRIYLCKWGATQVPDGCEGISREKFEYRYKPLGWGSSSCW